MDRRLGTLLLAVVSTSLSGPALAGPLDPAAFASGGTLDLTSGSYAFVVSSSGVPTLAQYDGISYTTLYTGTVSAGGVNVFDFDSVTIGAGVTIAAANGGGAGPIALLSRGSEIIAGTIDVSGASGTYAMTAPQPGPGAGGGNAGGAGNSLNTGTGGQGGFVTTGGGGGGFAGAGSSAQNRFVGPSSVEVAGGQGGAGVAINLASNLLGGSSGGNAGSAIGGGGGGAIELGATQAIVLSGSVLANGGSGGTVQFGSGAGGGSGGAIFIHAEAMNISGTLSALGGAGGISGGGTGEAGGAGGGGAILLQSSIPGGNNGTPTVYVGNGQFNSSVQAVPEPSSLVLLATSCLGLIGASAVRKRARG